MLVLLITFIPYLAGILLIHPPSDLAALSDYIQRYLYFIVLFGSWTLFQRLALTWMSASGGEKKRPSFLVLIGLGTCAILALFSLQFFKLKFQDSTFFIALAVMGCLPLAEAAKRRFKTLAFFLAYFLYVTGVGYLSLQAASPNGTWQALVFSAALGSAVCLAPIAEWLCSIAKPRSTNEKQPPASTPNRNGIVKQSAGAILKRYRAKRKKQPSTAITNPPASGPAQESLIEPAIVSRWELRAFTFFLVLAPFCLGVLIYCGQLAPTYALCFSVLPLSQKPLTYLHIAETSKKLPPEFTAWATRISAVFMAIILAVSLSSYITATYPLR